MANPAKVVEIKKFANGLRRFRVTLGSISCVLSVNDEYRDGALVSLRVYYSRHTNLGRALTKNSRMERLPVATQLRGAWSAPSDLYVAFTGI